MTGFASRRSHIARARASASSRDDAVTSSTRCFPMRTCPTSAKPSACSACSTACPWGSSKAARGMTRTSTRKALIRFHALAKCFVPSVRVRNHNRSGDLGLVVFRIHQEAEQGRAQNTVHYVGEAQREEERVMLEDPEDQDEQESREPEESFHRPHPRPRKRGVAHV